MSKNKELNQVLTDAERERLIAFGINDQELQQSALELPKLVRRRGLLAWEVGKRLSEIKPGMNRKQWVTFLDRWVHIHENSARRYMLLVEAWPTREEFRQEVKELAESGAEVTLRFLYEEAGNLIAERTGKRIEKRKPRTNPITYLSKFCAGLDECAPPHTEEEVQEYIEFLERISQRANELAEKARRSLENTITQEAA